MPPRDADLPSAQGEVVDRAEQRGSQVTDQREACLVGAGVAQHGLGVWSARGPVRALVGGDQLASGTHGDGGTDPRRGVVRWAWTRAGVLGDEVLQGVSQANGGPL